MTPATAGRDESEGVIHSFMRGVLSLGKAWTTTAWTPARTDEVLMAMDATRRSRMDGKTFDSLTKLTSTSTGRRRLVQAAAAAGIGGFLARSGATAQVVAEACQRRQSSCTRDRQCECNRGEEFKNVVCDPLARKCDKRGERCCGRSDATCGSDCGCCRGYRCNSSNRCERR
jgi:hypothetical protein